MLQSKIIGLTKLTNLPVLVFKWTEQKHRQKTVCVEPQERGPLWLDRNSKTMIVSQVVSLFLFHTHSVPITKNTWEYAHGQSQSQQQEAAERVFIT